MLTEIRDRSSGWFAYVIASLIIIPMAFWGVQEYASTEANPSLIKVGEQKVTQAQYQAQLNNEQQRMRQAMGENVDSDFLNSDGFKQNVMRQMLNRSLLEHVAVEQNYRIGDAQLADSIKQSELFQIEGKFDAVAYEQYVIGSQYSKTRYENALRADKLLNQVSSGYQESALVLPEEVRRLLEIQAEQRSFDLLTLKQQNYLPTVQVNEAEIAEYYAANQASFLNNEQISVDYLELNKEDMASEVEVDEDELLALYEQNAESYISQETRETRHILLNTGGDADDEQQLAKAEQLVIELKAGADFAELAGQHSQDPGSASRGGSLGVVGRGQMVPEFEEAAFRLAEGAISDPVKSQFGYHIIQVQDIETPQQQSFADVKFDLMVEERDRLAEDALLEQKSLLGDLAYEQTDNLDSAAEQLGLSIASTEFFDRDSGTGIANSAAVRNAAFSEEVLVDEVNSEPIEVVAGQFVVIRKSSYQPSEPKPLSEVSAQIKDILITEKASDAAQTAGEQLLESAKANWAALAVDPELAISSHTVALIDNNRAVPADVLAQVNALQLAGASASFASIRGINGDYYVVRLTGVVAGDLNKVSEQVKDSTRRVLAQRNGSAMMMSYLEGLKEDLQPEINQDLL